MNRSDNKGGPSFGYNAATDEYFEDLIQGRRYRSRLKWSSTLSLHQRIVRVQHYC